MKLNFRVPLPFALLLLATGFSAVPAQAQWIIFNPSEYAQLGSIWAEDVSTGVKIGQTVAQGTQLIGQGLKIYTLAMQETTALRNKNFMLAAGVLSQLQPIPGHPDWTIAMRSAGGPLAAAGVWQRMTAPGGTVLGRIQLADSFGASMINSLGSCQAAALQSDGAIRQLESVALSMGTLDNTRAALGGATNMGITQQLRIQECQHNLQQQQAQLQMVQLMRQRDYDNAQLSLYNNITTTATSNPHNISNVSGIYTAYFQ